MHIKITRSFQRTFEGMVDDRSYALLTTRRPPARAVVLVHGFAGDPHRTWHRLEDFLDEGWWESSDVFFFGYPSARQAIRASAHRLERFLADLIPSPPGHLLPEADGTSSAPEGPYRELILAAHSQGGLVVRQAVVEALWEVTPDTDAGAAERVLERARVRLFAPALWGARLSGLAGLAVRSFGTGSIARLLLGASPSYGEMQQGSTLMPTLQKETERLAARNPAAAALSAAIAWAEHDDVVLPGSQYGCDPKSIWLRGTNHRTVCKIPAGGAAALEFLKSG